MHESPTAAPETPASAPPDAAAPTPSDRLAQMSPVETAAWRKDGTVPGVPSGGDAPVASAQGDGDPGEDHSEAQTPAAPAPTNGGDPVASAAARTLQKRKQTAQERINELAREKYRLEGELKALRESSRPAAAAEAPPGISFKDGKPWIPAPTPAPASGDGPVEPQEEDFATYAAFVKATARYEHRLAQAEMERTQTAQQQQQARAAAAAAHDARVRTFAAAHPDYLDIIANQTEVYPSPLLAEAVLHSELAPELAYHLNTHVDEYRALVALPPGPLLQALGRLEQRLVAAGASPAPASPPNHVTRAPAPPVTLGSRPGDPADEVERAGARRDVGAYLRAANAREIAARRSGS